MQSDGFNLIFIILKLHTKFQINSPDNNEKKSGKQSSDRMTDRQTKTTAIKTVCLLRLHR